MAADAIKAGARIGPYELVSPIGAGGMGEVWKARDTRLDRVVAIKFSQAQFTDRFEREARAIAALNHPNIAQIYDVGENYIVMEFVDGEPVRAPDSIRKLLEIVVQIADGLAAAHTAGFVHRDLKPDNILSTKSGRVKILDFGLAKQVVAGPDDATVAITNPGTVAGTVAYMSPEQARGQELHAQSDQFSFGLVLYELTTGKRAFQRPSAPETLAAIIREEAEALPATVPAPLRWINERLLAKDANDRYASTKDLFAELRAMLGRLSEVSAVQVSGAAAPANRVSRALALVAVVAGLAALTLAVLALATASRTPLLDASHYRLTPLAASAANESRPAWSPDGRTIAYSTATGGVGQIVVKRVDRGTAPVALVQLQGGGLSNLSWSPDGERIYYGTFTGKSYQVAFVARAGGRPTVVLDAGPFDKRRTSYDASPVLSPDGKTLAMLGIQFSQDKPARRLLFSSPPGAAPKPIGDPLPCCIVPAFLAWSPDNSRVLARIPGEQGWTLFMISRGGQARVLLQVPSLDVEPTFSWIPGSRYIVISTLSSYGGDQGLRLLDSESGKISPLLPSATPLIWPSVSRDGSRIAYVTRTRRYELLEFPLSGGSPRPLAPSQVDQHSVAFSPKRDEFAFVRLNQIIVHDRERDEERALVSTEDFPAALSQPLLTWLEYSPDGERIVFTCSGCERELSFWIVPVRGGSPAKVGGGGDGGFGASWSPDGQWIVYVNTQNGRSSVVSKLRVGSGDKPVKFADMSCGPAWSPSGEWILCSGRRGLKLISTDGATIRDLSETTGMTAWSRDGRIIYNTRAEGQRLILERVDPATGHAATLMELPPGFRPSSPIAGARLSVSADGKTLAVSTVAGDGDIWILDGFEPPGSFWKNLWPLKR